MKIAVYDPYFDTLGGGERYCTAFAKVFLDRGDQVDIWWSENISGQIKDRFGIDISGAHFIHRRSSWGYDILFWVSDGSLPLSLAKKTLIHFQFPFTAVAGKSLLNSVKSHFYTFLANSQFTKQFVDSEFGINSYVLYPPVGVEEIKPQKKENIILYVGRFSNLTQQKGQRVLVDIFKKISGRIPGWKLILAGGKGVGANETDMRRLVSSTQNYSIDIITNPSWTKLKQLYAKSKIYLSASGYGVDPLQEALKVEHFGISLVEAMAGGCVPVVIDAGGHREIVTSHYGYLWTDTQQAKRILVDLCGNEAQLQLFASRARKKSLEFGYNVFKQRLLHLV